jgi:hypothetical protein
MEWKRLWRVTPDGMVDAVTSAGPMTESPDGMKAEDVGLGDMQWVAMDGTTPVVTMDPFGGGASRLVRIDNGVVNEVATLSSGIVAFAADPQGGFAVVTSAGFSGTANELLHLASDGSILERTPTVSSSPGIAVDGTGAVLFNHRSLTRQGYSSLDTEAMRTPSGIQPAAAGIRWADTTLRPWANMFPHGEGMVTGATAGPSQPSILVVLDEFVADPFDPDPQITTQRAAGSRTVDVAWKNCTPDCAQGFVGTVADGKPLVSFRGLSDPPVSQGSRRVDLAGDPELDASVYVAFSSTYGAIRGRVIGLGGPTAIPATLPLPVLAPAPGAINGYVKQGTPVRFMTSPGLPTECRFSKEPVWERCIDGVTTMRADVGVLMSRVRVDGRTGPIATSSVKVDTTVPKPTFTRASPGSISSSISFGIVARDDGSGLSHVEVRTATIKPKDVGWGSWETPYSLRKVTSSRFSLIGSPGVTRCASLRGVDRLGNKGDWSAPQCRTMLRDDRELSRSGDWERKSATWAYGRSYLWTRSSDAIVRIGGVRQPELLLRTRMCRTCGRVVVTYGSNTRSVSLYSRTTRAGVILKLPIPRLADPQARTVTIRLTSKQGNLVDGLAVYPKVAWLPQDFYAATPATY